MKKHYLLLLTLLLTLAACHKDDTPQDCPPDLPCATQTGENTFGCYINGEPWVAEIAPYIFDPTLHEIEAEYDEEGNGNDNGNLLSIKATKSDKYTDGFISINLKPIQSIGVVSHTNSLIFQSSGLIVKKSNGQFVSAIGFDLDTFYAYNVEITHLDIEKNIVSGTFSFTGTSSTDTVKITDGRFDIQYNPY